MNRIWEGNLIFRCIAKGNKADFEIWGTGEATCLSGEWISVPSCSGKLH